MNGDSTNRAEDIDMIINVTCNGKKLVESGTFNHVLDSADSSEVSFAYDGLKVKLHTRLLPEDYNKRQILEGEVKDGVVFLTHAQQLPALTEPTGMLVPLEVGKRGQTKIYFSWLTLFFKSNAGVMVASTTYSFYEDVL